MAAGVPNIAAAKTAGIGMAISVAPIDGAVGEIVIPGCDESAESCEGVMLTAAPSGMVITTTASSTALDRETISGFNRKAETISNVSTFFIGDSF
jgi:hypothetical protein